MGMVVGRLRMPVSITNNGTQALTEEPHMLPHKNMSAFASPVPYVAPALKGSQAWHAMTMSMAAKRMVSR